MQYHRPYEPVFDEVEIAEHWFVQSKLDDLAIALYVDIDDALEPLALRRGAGRPALGVSI